LAEVGINPTIDRSLPERIVDTVGPLISSGGGGGGGGHPHFIPIITLW